MCRIATAPRCREGRASGRYSALNMIHRAGEAEDDAERSEHHPLSQNERENVPRRCGEGGANADLARSFGDAAGDHTVDPPAASTSAASANDSSTSSTNPRSAAVRATSAVTVDTRTIGWLRSIDHTARLTADLSAASSPRARTTSQCAGLAPEGRGPIAATSNERGSS